MSDKEVKEELKPIIVCQFIFHPQTGEIEGGFHDGLSLHDLLRMKNVIEEKLVSAQLDITLQSTQAIQAINSKMNILLQSQKAMLGAISKELKSKVEETKTSE